VKSKQSIKIVARNRKATHDYSLGDRFEAGIVLSGSEIKSIRAGNISIKEAYVRFHNKEAWLENAHISAYDPASVMNHEPRRSRKLLLHRRELDRLAEDVHQRGYTIVPTKVYLTHGKAKIEIALAKGKKQYDKRRDIAERDSQREIDRALARKDR
jgi:SsrA-binding protein